MSVIGAAAVQHTECWSKVKYCSCPLPWYEIILDSIPGAGMIPSAIGWGWRERKVRVLEQEIQAKIRLKEAEDLLSMSPDSQRVATPIGESPPDSPPPADGFSEMQTPFVEQPSEDSWLTNYEELCAKRSNSAVLFWVNFMVSTVAGAVVFGLHRYNKF